MSSCEGLRVAAGVVVEKHDGIRRFLNRKSEYLARVEYRRVKRAFKNRGFGKHLAPPQVTGEVARFARAGHVPFGIETQHANNFLREIPHFRHHQVCNIARRGDTRFLGVKPRKSLA